MKRILKYTRPFNRGGPYKMVALAPADASSYVVSNLAFSGTRYYYKLRAINSTAASASSNEASGITEVDTQAPTAPANLVISGTSRGSISISWSASTDDVAVIGYDIYVNGVKSYTTPLAQFTINDLTNRQSYTFTVRARDFANNISPASNQVSGQPILTGLNYKYYTFTGTWNNLPDFNTLTPGCYWFNG
ncbi:MAG: fibronectin type III domain-containing protein [Chitinophagaceae bacterium]